VPGAKPSVNEASFTGQTQEQYSGRALEAQYPGLMAFTGAPAEVQRLAREFASTRGTPLDGLERVYLVDPNGNLVLSYAPDADASGMRKDLARLLRLSQIG
jgi:hypothetical protein